METKEYRTVDKSSWDRGEWDGEPDKMQFQDEATGLPCLIVRGPSGALCGYVGLSADHPLHGKQWDEAADINVHGGLTFSDFCQPSEDESRHVCHTPAAGEPDHVWWLGFDCAHSGDYCPSYSRHKDPIFQRSRWEQYRDVGYVRGKIEYLARQLAAIA